jgi:hypothetical protein
VVLGRALVNAILIIAFTLSSRFVSVGIASLMLALGAMAGVIYHTSTNTLLQLAAPDAIRGRVMGLYSMSTFGLQIFNGPAVGTLAALLGVSASLTILAGGIIAVTLAIAVRVPSLRTMD